MSNSQITNSPPSKNHDANLLMHAMFADALATFKDISDKYTEICARLNTSPSLLTPEMAEQSRLSAKRTAARYGRPIRFSKPIRSVNRYVPKKNRFQNVLEQKFFSYLYISNLRMLH
jgi:hypothetical protein